MVQFHQEIEIMCLNYLLFFLLVYGFIKCSEYLISNSLLCNVYVFYGGCRGGVTSLETEMPMMLVTFRQKKFRHLTIFSKLHV